MTYPIQGLLIVIAFFSGWMAKRQIRKAMEEGIYNIGNYKLKPLTGEAATRMAKRGLFIAQFGPWLVLILIIVYDVI